MIIRQTFNFAAHLAAGVAFGLLAVAACKACRNWRCGVSEGNEPKAEVIPGVSDPDVNATGTGKSTLATS